MLDFVNDELFDLEKSQEYILSIQVSLGGFSFSVVSTAENKLLAFTNTPLKISNESLIARRFEEWIDSIDLLRKPYKTIRVIVCNDKFTLVPNNYDSEELTKNIPTFLFSENTDIEIKKSQIELLKTKLIFSLPKGLNDVLSKKLRTCEIIHPVNIISTHLPETKEKQGLVLLFDVKSIYITLYNADKILLSNNFKINHVNDVTYYVLTTLKQLKIGPKSTDMFYAGDFDQENEVLHQLKNYFSSMSTLPDKTPLEFDDEKFTLSVHQNLTLYS